MAENIDVNELEDEIEEDEDKKDLEKEKEYEEGEDNEDDEDDELEEEEKEEDEKNKKEKEKDKKREKKEEEKENKEIDDEEEKENEEIKEVYEGGKMSRKRGKKNKDNNKTKKNNVSKDFIYKCVETKMLKGGAKIVRKVAIKNGKGYKSISRFTNGKKSNSTRKKIRDHDIEMIEMGKFIPGLFKDCEVRIERKGKGKTEKIIKCKIPNNSKKTKTKKNK